MGREQAAPPGGLAGEARALDAAAGAAMASPGPVPLPELIGCYHRALGVRAAAAAAARAPGGAPPEAARAAEAAVARFDAGLHRRALRQLDASVGELAGRLRAAAGAPREGEAGLYEELRALMSAREFAGQYERGLA